MRMLQHETGHLDAFCTSAIVAPYAASAAQAFNNHGGGVDGLAWTPGIDPNPFDD